MKLKELKMYRVLVCFLLLLILASNVYYYLRYTPSSNLAQVQEVISEKNDGGLIYQQLSLQLLDGTKTQVLHESSGNPAGELEEGDRVSISQLSNDTYQITAKSYFLDVTIMFIILTLMVVLMVGLDDARYLVPMLIVASFLSSGLFNKMNLELGITLTAFLIFALVTFSYACLTLRSILKASVIIFVVSIVSLITGLVYEAFYTIFDLNRLRLSLVPSSSLATKEYDYQMIIKSIYTVFGIITFVSVAAFEKAIFAKTKAIKGSSFHVIKTIFANFQKKAAISINILFFIVVAGELFPSTNSRTLMFWEDHVTLAALSMYMTMVTAFVFSILIASIAAIILSKYQKKNHYINIKNLNHGKQIRLQKN